MHMLNVCLKKDLEGYDCFVSMKFLYASHEYFKSRALWKTQFSSMKQLLDICLLRCPLSHHLHHCFNNLLNYLQALVF